MHAAHRLRVVQRSSAQGCSAHAFVRPFVFTFVPHEDLLQHWMRPLANGALCEIALASVLIVRNFVLQLRYTRGNLIRGRCI